MARLGRPPTKAEQEEPVEVLPIKCIGPCKKIYKKQKGNFPPVQSVLYASNNCYLPWCNNCVDAFYMRYRNECGLTEDEAIKRLCSKFDIYWSMKVFNMMPSAVSATQSRMRAYISKSNLQQFAGKTYDDTIDEEARASSNDAGSDTEEVFEVTPEMEKFWGRGKTGAEYHKLQGRFDELIADCATNDAATQMLVKQACLSEHEIDMLQKEGKSFEKQQNSLANTIGALNLKPSQLREAEKNSGLDNMPLGVGIMRWEQTRPVGDPDPEWEDVDGIAHDIAVWYTGASMRMVGFKNELTDLFQKEIDKYTVKREGDSQDDDIDGMKHFIERGGR